MKLISFAVISFLAITVSAYPHQDPDEQDVEQSQGASSQSEQQHQGTTVQSEHQARSTIAQVLQGQYRQSLKDVLVNLNEDYNAKQVTANYRQDDINKIEKGMLKIESEINALSGLEKAVSVQHLSSMHRSLARTRDSKRILEYDMKLILEELQDVERAIAALDVTQE
ncbi:hypothetical protein BASA61_003336 [Batrachochytrium salamandrivorans]|nr:hypothetical protein BASA61_003336 [Batrachochytrium salamandrivorans]